MKFFTKYDRGANPSMEFTEPSLTEQCHKDDCDVNRILDRYARVGALALEKVHMREGRYFDAVGAPASCKEMFDRTVYLQQEFDQLPAKVREKFGNSAAVMYDWLADPANADEAVKLGILTEEDVIRLQPKPDEGRDSSLLDRTVTTDTGGDPEVSDEK